MSSSAVKDQKNSTTNDVSNEVIIIGGRSSSHDQISEVLGAGVSGDELAVEIASHARHQVGNDAVALLIDLVQQRLIDVQVVRQASRSLRLRLLLQMKRRLALV